MVALEALEALEEARDRDGGLAGEKPTLGNLRLCICGHTSLKLALSLKDMPSIVTHFYLYYHQNQRPQPSHKGDNPVQTLPGQHSRI